MEAIQDSGTMDATLTGEEVVNDRKEKRPLSASSYTDETVEKKKKLADGESEQQEETTNVGDNLQDQKASDSNFIGMNEDEQDGHETNCSSNSNTINTESYKNTNVGIDNEIFETDEVSAEATKNLMYKLFKLSDPSQIHNEGATKSDITLPITSMVKCMFSPDKARPGSRENKQTPDPKLESILNENNQFLRSISARLDNVNSILKCNTDEISTLTDRAEQFESLVEGSTTKVNSSIFACDQSKSELTKLIGDSYKYVDEKFGNLKEAIPETIAEMSLEFDAKLKVHKTEVVVAISDEVAKIPAAAQLQNKLHGSLDTKFTHKLSEVDSKLNAHYDAVTALINEKTDQMFISEQSESRIELNLLSKIEQNFNEKLLKAEMGNSTKLATLRSDLNSLLEREKERDDRVAKLEKSYDDEISRLKDRIESLGEKFEAYSGLSIKIDKIADELESLKCGDNMIDGAQGNGSGISRLEWRQQKSKTDDLCERMYILERRADLATKHRNRMDCTLRKTNVLIDKLSERENENVRERVDEILKLALRPADFDQIKVLNAYRLGKSRARNNPRKIMIELADPKSKDLIMQFAKQITKVGNNGAPFYLNEDMPEALKRAKTDIFKYKRYLEEKKHTVEQFGDYFVIDGRRIHQRDLNNLPVGMRIMDSRTLYGRGTVAFQSALSPLSNLFPCRIKFNGVYYTSTEQAYQFAKAIHHGSPLLAKDIKAEIDPHEIMNMGNSIEIDNEWASKRFDVMENIIRHKADQVGIFYDCLKQTGNHRIVENTSSETWGSACAFNSLAVWNGTFRGQNRMGQILERVRDSV